MLVGAPGLTGLIDNVQQIAPAAGDRLQFQNDLVQTAAAGDATKQPPASFSAPAQATTEVSRATTHTASIGERILQNLSAVHRGSAAPGAGNAEPALKASQPGPAEQSLTQPNAARLPGLAPGADNFDAMIASLQSVYNNVIQVSLVSKSTGSFSSSVNKLMSAS
ncbi:nodulation protein NolB [Bosea sp. (in: a-proteobacteria)]|jgi:hypothetical protein|uniref:nodulation protein NolB n=1 Tax=Bosea sp. (in: a-proteobacteria) TaxID=1871050 RepID=UPI003F6F5F2E